MQFLLTGLVAIAEENCPRQATFLFGDLKTTVVFTVLELTISARITTGARGWYHPPVLPPLEAAVEHPCRGRDTVTSVAGQCSC